MMNEYNTANNRTNRIGDNDSQAIPIYSENQLTVVDLQYINQLGLSKSMQMVQPARGPRASDIRPPVTKTKCQRAIHPMRFFLCFSYFFGWQMAHMSHVNKQYFFEERGPHWNGYSRALMEAFKIFQSFKIIHFYLGSIERMVSMMFKAPKPEVEMCRLSQMHFLDRVGFTFFGECLWII